MPNFFRALFLPFWVPGPLFAYFPAGLGGSLEQQPLSKHCPSAIQALSKQIQFQSKLGNCACPNLCVYADLGFPEVRPSAFFIILKSEEDGKTCKTSTPRALGPIVLEF